MGLAPGDVSICVPCPDLNHVTFGPATSVLDCHCKKGFVSSGDYCKGKKRIEFSYLMVASSQHQCRPLSSDTVAEQAVAEWL